MEDANNGKDLDAKYCSEASTGYKRKRDSKLRSKVWQHFTKIIREDGKCERCRCNHCHKQFSCSSRSGTTHLLRHITDGICPVFKKDKTMSISSYAGEPIQLLPWNVDQGLGQCSTQDVEVEVLHEKLTKTMGDEYLGQTPRPKLLQHSASRSTQPKGEAWMTEFRNCVAKLVELANGRTNLGPLQVSAATGPDYSVAAALKCLNEMEDISQSSDMYLDAVEIFQDAGDRECFICLPPEPRRRWLQRVLHRRHPLQYSSNIESHH